MRSTVRQMCSRRQGIGLTRGYPFHCAGASIVALVIAVAGAANTENDRHTAAWDFEDAAPGAIPPGWLVEGTQQQGPLATWGVVVDSTAPKGRRVLALTSPNHSSSGTFNLCWTKAASFRDGEIVVRFKANAGEEDQGGGPIWRVRDRDNYYICRANPLENNFRLYSVKDGKRKQLASAEVEVASNQWHEIRVQHIGNHIVCALNGVKLLEVEDATFPEAGSVGLWTKADAATAFDGVEVTPHVDAGAARPGDRGNPLR